MTINELERNVRFGNTLKIAVESASCELIARIDSGDYSYPDRFTEQLKVFTTVPTIDIIGGNMSFIDVSRLLLE